MATATAYTAHLLTHEENSIGKHCKVCQHYGLPTEMQYGHTPMTGPDENAIRAVHEQGYQLVRPITGSTTCPVLMNTTCPNWNCFNHGEVRFPTLGHSRSHCPCSWTARRQTNSKLVDYIPFPQNGLSGEVPPPPPPPVPNFGNFAEFPGLVGDDIPQPPPINPATNTDSIVPPAPPTNGIGISPQDLAFEQYIENFVDSKLAQQIDEHATLFAECDREDLIELEEQFELHNTSPKSEIGTAQGLQNHNQLFQRTFSKLE